MQSSAPISSPLVLFVTSSTASFFNHRIGVAREALRRGYRVALAAPDMEGFTAQLTVEQVTPVFLSGGRRGIDPLGDMTAAFNLARHVGTAKPDVVHATGLKGMFVTALARLFGRLPRTVTTVTGLGATYISDGFKNRLIRGGIEQVLKTLLWNRNTVTIFQNGDDMKLFVSRGVAPAAQSVLIPGSGVDISEFALSPEPDTDVPVIVFPARLIATKGLREFISAAQLLRQRGVKARFALVGSVDPVNPDAVSQEEIDQAVAQGSVEAWGFRSDMTAVLAGCNLVCLPSYREGVPKALIEAAAVGRAIVATDVPGCREIVVSGETGLLAPAREFERLADALQSLIEDGALRRQYGLAGRRLVETEFALDHVVARTIALYDPPSR
ncbi:glycosyltransferase family 4 protein [Brevundimonas sp.]|uniref:glycosyltransferase family 4 protein n=1 Tax=Brevundimonas sp. TaxID=1871086 RepID=UPI00262057BE|nr:glycosyltransferase family 4 protein [Brevundimonas sp.]